MEFSGIIHKIFEEVHISATFKKREVILEVIETSSKGEEFPQYINFQFTQDKTELLNSYKVGDAVEILFISIKIEILNPQFCIDITVCHLSRVVFQ